MTLEVTLDEVPVSATNVLVGGTGNRSVQSLPAAADGTGSIGAVTFDDPDGSMTVTGWQVVRVTEDDCVSAPTLFYGFVGDRTYQRGPYKDGAARVIDTSLVDHNTMLTCRIVTGGSANRPSETQAARLAWLLGTDAVVPMFSDLGLVDGTTKVLDAANYRGMYPAEVLADLCTTREEIFFTYWDQAAESVGLFFDTPESTAFTCSLTVSNVLSDVDDTTCFAPMLDGELVVDPQDVYTTGSMVYTGGTEYAIYGATYAFFDAPSPILTRSFRVENDKVGRSTTAHALLMLMLARDSTERETLKFTVRVPSTKVGLIQAGMRISCRFSHLPGFESFAYTRIERLVYVPVEGEPTLYDVALECSTHGLGIPGGSGGGSTDPFPHQVSCTTATLVQSAEGSAAAGTITPTFGSDVTPGNLIVAAVIFHDNQPGLNMPTMTGWTMTADSPITVPNADGSDNADGTMAMFYRTAADGDGNSYSAGDISISTRVVLMEFSGTWAVDVHDTDSASGTSGNTAFPNPLGSVSVTGESLVVGIGIWSAPALGGTVTIDRGTVVADGDPGLQGPPLGVSYEAVSTNGTVAPTMTLNVGFTATNGHAGMIQVFKCSSASEAPRSGKMWGPLLPNETPNGSTTVFTVPTGYTWAAGSLKVFVDRLDQTAAVTSEDGAAGTFTLGFAPAVGMLVEVYGTEI